MNKLTEIEKAYIAGFFDGEGCISISKYQGKNNRTPVFSLQVVIAQKGIDTIAELYEATGVGSIHNRTKYHKGTYEWRINPVEAKLFLISILPYLRNKKREAEIAIQFADVHNRSSLRGKGKGKGYTIPQEVVDEKEKYRVTLQELKGTSSASRGRPKVQKRL